jgi:hypothetical protein
VKLIPRRKKPTQLETQLAEFNRETAKGHLQEAIERVEAAIPAGSLIATRTGTVAHVKSGLPGERGALCEAMRQWEDWRVVRSSEGLRPCHRCELARDGKAAS